MIICRILHGWKCLARFTRLMKFYEIWKGRAFHLISLDIYGKFDFEIHSAKLQFCNERREWALIQGIIFQHVILRWALFCEHLSGHWVKNHLLRVYSDPTLLFKTDSTWVSVWNRVWDRMYWGNSDNQGSNLSSNLSSTHCFNVNYSEWWQDSNINRITEKNGLVVHKLQGTGWRKFTLLLLGPM